MATDHKPTLRTLHVLELISGRDGKYTLSEISRESGISTSTLFPILHTLRERKYLSYNEKNQTYSLGLRLFEIGSRIQSSRPYDEITELMSQIVEACGETCHFGILEGGDVLYLAKVDSQEPIRMYSTIGRRLPAYGTAIGKALLKNSSMERLQELYPEGLKPLTANTITSFDEFHEQVNSTDIFTYENEESNLMVRCVAIPIYHQGTVAAAVSIAIPTFRFQEEKLACAERALKQAVIQFERIIPYFVF